MQFIMRKSSHQRSDEESEIEEDGGDRGQRWTGRIDINKSAITGFYIKSSRVLRNQLVSNWSQIV